jgi:hypothetical protein
VKTNYVLIDYENVQPKDLSLLYGGPFKVRVFLGPHHAKKVETPLAMALQSFGKDAEYILLESHGPNALDFHIAYYIGVLSNQEPEAFFHILSKDAGFDPLIKHLKGKNILAQRSDGIADIPYFKRNAPDVTEVHIQAVIADLIRRKSSTPGTQKALLNTMQALFKNELSELQISSLFALLRERGVVKLTGSGVSYNLSLSTNKGPALKIA